MKILFLNLTILIFIFGCSKESIYNDPCVEETIERFEMQPYNGEPDDCKLYLYGWLYKGEYAFQLEGPCFDAYFPPFDCNQDSICAKDRSVFCEDFNLNAEELGIIAVSQ